MYIGTENVTYIEDGVLFSHKDEQNYTFFRKIGKTGDHQINKYFMFSLMCGILIPKEEGQRAAKWPRARTALTENTGVSAM